MVGLSIDFAGYTEDATNEPNTGNHQTNVADYFIGTNSFNWKLLIGLGWHR